ncbi:hypothetical protein ACIBCO_41130 [Streptomyces violascens]
MSATPIGHRRRDADVHHVAPAGTVLIAILKEWRDQHFHNRP